MITWLVAVSILLLCSTLFLLYAKMKRDRDLHYIYEKLNTIWECNTNEKVQLFTEDQNLISLLVVINRLLEQKNKIALKYNEKEISMHRLQTNMAHDLKTPLTVILGNVEMLSLEVDMKWEAQQKLLVKIQQKAEQMLKRMHQFFDLAKIESNDMMFPLEKTNLNEVCKDNMLFFYDLIITKGLEVDIDIPASPVLVASNRNALDRVLKNLISNAICYGSEGQIIGLRLRNDIQFAWIEVWDQGKGMSEKEQKLIFERLYTLEDARTGTYQGSGLGLTITKRLVEKLNGSIKLKSKPYDKTTFTIQFDLDN